MQHAIFVLEIPQQEENLAGTANIRVGFAVGDFLDGACVVCFIVESRFDIQAGKNDSRRVISYVCLCNYPFSFQIIYGFYRSGRNNMKFVMSL
jgi:hypothetical protein